MLKKAYGVNIHVTFKEPCDLELRQVESWQEFNMCCRDAKTASGETCDVRYIYLFLFDHFLFDYHSFV